MFSLKYEWEHDYVAAILEEDNGKLASRIDAAVAKMLARINELNSDHGGNPEELEALATAMGGLHRLRIERLPETRSQHEAEGSQERDSL